MRHPSPVRRRSPGSRTASLHSFAVLLTSLLPGSPTASLHTALVLLTSLLFTAANVASAAPSSSLPVRPLPSLDTSGMSSNGISLGFLTQWGVDEPSDVRRLLGASPVAWGDYLNVNAGSEDEQFRQVDYHLDEVVESATGNVKAVYIPAVLFNGRMNQWTPELSSALAQKMRSLNRRGVNVYLRFCYEMNGGWMKYGLDPLNFVATWRSLTTAIRAVTNETFMLWAPNVAPSGISDDDVQAYEPYWPGEEYVDAVGLSLYSFGPERSINRVPSSDLFRESFQPFYDLVSPSSASSSDNPLGLSRAYEVLIAETSAPFYYNIPSNTRFWGQAGDTDITQPFPNLTRLTPSLADRPYARSDDELAVKASWLAQLTGNATAQRFPNLKLVNLFNYLKKGNATAEVIADFRYVGSDSGFNATVEAWFRHNVGNQSAYEQGYTGAAGALRPATVASVVGAIVAAVVLL